MSDKMLHGVLNMPTELWSDDPVDKCQRYCRYVEASERIKYLNEALIAITARCDNWEAVCSSQEISLIDEMLMLNSR